MKQVELTQEGFNKLQAEHQELLNTKRPATIERLQKARAMGDLSENSEYSAAKDELGLVEGRIQEIEEILKNITIIAETKGSVISLGSKVVAETNGERQEFHIVGEFEADPLNNKLSQTSPIGKALLGKNIGEIVEIKIPAGKTTYKILEVQ